MLDHLKTCTIAALLLAVSSSGPLRAGTAYAYSVDTVDVTFGNGTASNPVTTMAYDTASYLLFGEIDHPAPLDPPQAYVGPTPNPPPQNSFSPFGPTGMGYSRSDAQIVGTTVDQLTGNNVAEAYRTTPGTASAFADNSFSFDFTPTNPNQPITIGISAAPMMQVTTTGNGLAIADVGLTVLIYDHATGKLLLTWTPNGDPDTDHTLTAGGISGDADPFNLNQEIICASDGCDKSYSPGLFTGQLGYTGAVGEVYDITVDWAEAVNVAIPEPATVGLTGGGLILFGLALKRKVAWTRPVGA